MDSDLGLKSDIKEEFTLNELKKIAYSRGLRVDINSKDEVIDWLISTGLTRREYELQYNPYINQKLHICKFFGIRKSWRVLDVGCGSGGTSIAIASLVGNEGYVLAVDSWDEYLERCVKFVRKIGYQDIIETKLANVMDLDFETDSFDMIVLLYSPQFLGYRNELNEVLSKIKKWTRRIGIADHIPVPSTFEESVYLLYSWLSNDLARTSLRKKTDRLFHPEEVREAIKSNDWKLLREKTFKVSIKNAFPLWAMKDNIKRLTNQIQNLKDPAEKEIYSSRLETIKTFMQKRKMAKPTSMYAVVAQK
jgi:ubiquinone/menaquinone biosynthesis C-methylase UbiE